MTFVRKVTLLTRLSIFVVEYVQHTLFDLPLVFLRMVVYTSIKVI